MNEKILNEISGKLDLLLSILVHKHEQTQHKKSIGASIRQARNNQGISMEKLSRIAGCSHGYLSDLENGNIHKPSAEMIIKIAKALNMSMEDF